MQDSSQYSKSDNLRLRRFLYATVSGYTHLVANVLYVLASVPLALHFLQKREFGLWAVVTQLGGYLQLVDIGMSASLSRHLVDHKDNRHTGEYGGIIRTGGLVLLAQGFLVLLGGVVLVLCGTRYLHIDSDLESAFKVVMFWQCAIIAADFPARLFFHILLANQRLDVVNWSQIASFFLSFVTLWFCLANGVGVFSVVWANLANWLLAVTISGAACLKFNLLPSGIEWGRATWAKFKELFKFGKDVFWIALGNQMISASQAIIVTRILGLSSAATWSVCTRSYTLANQVVWRPFDSSTSALSEMVARSENDRLEHRFQGLVTLTVSFSVVAAAIFALCNQPFVFLWTHGRVGWSRENDVLLAIWLVVSAVVHCLSSLPLMLKQIRFMRYIYFIEGAAFLGIGTLAASRYGFAGMLTTSIFCSMIFSCSYCIWRTLREFDLNLTEFFLRWLGPSAKVFAVLALVSPFLYLASESLSAKLQFLIYSVAIGTIGTSCVLTFGLGRDLRKELLTRGLGAVSRCFKTIFRVCVRFRRCG